MSNNIIWQQTADLGTYYCQVARTGEKQGLLTVRLPQAQDAILHEQPIVLDTTPDIKAWQDICLDVIDHPVKRSNGIKG